MRYLPPVLALLALFVLILLAMLAGWRRRARRQQTLGEPYVPNAGGGALTGTPLGRGVYVTTTLAAQPLERVTAHGLGPRSRATVSDLDDAGTPLLEIGREGAEDLLIPWDAVASVHTSGGMIGKWMGGEALAVVRWRLGETLVDTGLRFEDASGQDALLARAAQLGVPHDPDPPAAPVPLPPAPPHGHGTAPDPTRSETEENA